MVANMDTCHETSVACHELPPASRLRVSVRTTTPRAPEDREAGGGHSMKELAFTL